MALPANFDIYYYRGDKYEFYLNVKDADGNPVNLEDGGYTGDFTIANVRGPSATFIQTGDVLIDGTQVICTITPTTGLLLTGGPYVYDVQVKSGDNVYTYVTGNVYVTLDVTEAT